MSSEMFWINRSAFEAATEGRSAEEVGKLLLDTIQAWEAGELAGLPDWVAKEVDSQRRPQR
jgi:hypothetical protein